MKTKRTELYTTSPQKGYKIKVGVIYKTGDKVTFTKTVDSTKHKMRLFDGYGIQKDVYDKYLRGKKGRIIIKEKDTGKVLVASIETWGKYHSGANYGDGKQIFLTVAHMHNSDNFNRDTTSEKQITNEEYKQGAEKKLEAMRKALKIKPNNL